MNPSLHLTCIHLLKDIKLYLEQVTYFDYKQPLELLFGSSVGQHTRHILDGFTCLFQQTQNSSCVNYELRKRDEILESNTRAAIAFIEDVISKLSKVEEEDQFLTLVVNYNTNENVSHFVNSTFQRELAHNIEHAIHHMAIIKIALRHSFTYVELPDHFGVAPSTLRYRNGIKIGESNRVTA